MTMKKMTPLDIQHMTFGRQLYGLKVEQVESFMQDMVGYAEELHRQVMELTAKTEKQKKRIDELEQSEREIKDTMKTAQKMTEHISEHAHKEADIIRQRAQMDAEKIIKRAHTRLAQIIEQINEIRKQKAQFYGKLKGVITTHQQLLDQGDNDDLFLPVEEVALLPNVS